MACPVQCSCGRGIAELHEAFETLYNAHVREHLAKSKIHPSKMSITEGEVPGIVYIFQALGIDTMCCRNKIKNFRNTVKMEYEYA